MILTSETVQIWFVIIQDYTNFTTTQIRNLNITLDDSFMNEFIKTVPNSEMKNIQTLGGCL